MSGRTPGPWKFVPAGGTSAYRDALADMGRFIGADGTVVCEFGDCTTHYPSEGSPPSDDDAILIAAAPCLLAFAESFVGRVEDDGEPSPGTRWHAEYVEAKALIARAQGGAQ